MANIFKLVGNIVVDNDKAISQIKETEDQAASSASKMKKKFRSSMKSLGKWAKRGAAVGAAAMAGLTVSSIRQFTKFDEKMREVYTLIPDASEDMKEKLSTDIREIGEQFGFLTDDTVPALYQALSAGVPPENVMSFMKTAAKSAKAGVTDLQTSVDGLTSAVNAYGEEVLNAKKASDIMFTAVKEGKTTYEELAANMSNVTPIAASLGVRFEDINAALATMTAQGMDTGKATIYLRAMLNQLSKSGSDANNVFKEMAGQTFTEFIDSGHSLANALELMEEYADENNTTIKKLFSNVRAGTGALQLTGANMETFIENLGEMEDSAGSTEEAYTEMSESVQQTLDELRSWWENQRIAIGEKLEEPLRDLLKFLKKNKGEISGLLEDTFQGIIDALKWIVNNKGKAITAIKGIGGAFATWKLMQLLGPLKGIVLALATLGTIKISKDLIKYFKGLKANVGSANDTIEEHGEIIGTLSQEEAKDWLRGLHNQADAMGLLGKKTRLMTDDARLLYNELYNMLEAYRDKYGEFPKFINMQEDFRGKVGETTRTLAESQKALDGVGDRLLSTTDDTLKLSDGVSGLETNLDDLNDATKEETIDLGKWHDQVEENIDSTGEINEKANKRFKIMQKVKGEIDKINQKEKFLGDQYDASKAKVKVYTEALKTLQGAGFSPTSKIVEELQNRIAKLTEETKDVTTATEKANKIYKTVQNQMAEARAKAKVLGDEYDLQERQVEILEDAMIKLRKAGLENTEVFDKIAQKLKEARGEAKETTTFWEHMTKSLGKNADSIMSTWVDAFGEILTEGKSTAEALGDAFKATAGDIGGMVGEWFGMPQTGRAVGNIVGKVWDWLFGPSEQQKRINKMAKNLKSSIGGSIQSAFSADTYQGFVEGFGESLESIVKSKLIQAFVTTGAMKDKIKQLSNYMAEAVADRTLDQGEKDKIRSMYKGIVEQTKPIYEMISGFSLGGTEAEPQSLPRGVRTALNRFRAGFEQIISSQSPGGRTITASEEAKISQYKQQLESQQGINIDLSDITIRSEQDIEDLAQRIYELFNDKKESGGELGPLANVARI